MTTIVALLIATGPLAAAEVRSPDGSVRVAVSADGGRLSFAIDRAGRPALPPSDLGLIVDGVHLGRGAAIVGVERYRRDERYPMRGGHAQAVDRCNGARISARHEPSGPAFTVEVRAFDDGAALRILVPDAGRPRVVEEATTFRLVPGSIVWAHDLHGHYEGVHARKAADAMKPGEWAAPPVTARLPDGSGYVAITEASLNGFAGMALQADGRLGLAAQLGHAHPASHPFVLRYKDDVDRLTRPAALAGALAGPWRVVMVAPDLNVLVNCDIVGHVSPPPDPAFFPEGAATSWIKPGRAVWRFLDGGQPNLVGARDFARWAGELGFEYNVLENFWRRWTDEQLRNLISESRSHGVGTWLWVHSKDLRTPEARRAFFEHCRDVGAAGAKIDFFDHEAKDVVDLYPALLREAARCRILVDFHGSNKPTGEARTWPNELGREGVYGLEHKGMKEWARHNTTLPFTRMLAGAADYTPVHLGDRRRETSWAHQIASAAVLSSPLLVYAANPRSLLANPAVGMIRSIPSTWDETIVLPPSEIGELAALARQSGGRWILAVLNGPEARSLRVPLAFLGTGTRQASMVRDRDDDSAAVRLDEATVSPGDALDVRLRAGGGFLARFDPPGPASGRTPEPTRETLHSNSENTKILNHAVGNAPESAKNGDSKR